MATARKRVPIVPHVRPDTGSVFVTLTSELPMGPHDRYPYFVGTHDGTPIRYHCLAVEVVVAIRRGLEDGGAVTHFATTSWLDLWRAEDASVGEVAANKSAMISDSPPPIPLSSDERVALGALRLLVERGVIGPESADGDAS
jgi:hypothetical protein